MNRLALTLTLLICSSLCAVVSAGHGYWGYGPRVGVAYYRPHVHYAPRAYYRPYVGYGWGGYANYYSSWSYRGFYPRTFVYSTNYAPFYTPLYYGYGGVGYRSFYPYYPSCQTTYYSNPVISSYVAPAAAPAEYYYGPQAVQRFLGQPAVNGFANNGNNVDVVGVASLILKALKPEAPQAPAVTSQPPIVVPTESLPLARSRARKMLEVGDRYFAEQKYFDASQKYQEAARTAPDLAEAQFRLAHAETALGRIPQAAAAYRQALATDPDVNRGGFQLDQLYGEHQIAKKSHLESIAAQALKAPDDSAYLLVVGMFLRYDGESTRAVKFLHKAWEMGDRAPNLAHFWEAKQPEVYVSENEI